MVCEHTKEADSASSFTADSFKSPCSFPFCPTSGQTRQEIPGGSLRWSQQEIQTTQEPSPWPHLLTTTKTPDQAQDLLGSCPGPLRELHNMSNKPLDTLLLSAVSSVSTSKANLGGEGAEGGSILFLWNGPTSEIYLNKAVIKNGRGEEDNIYSAHHGRSSSSNKIIGENSTKKLL